jgi:hypothetical protein
MKPAIGTSLAIIAVNCVGGLVGQLRYVNFDWRLTLGFLVAVMTGMFVGLALAKKLSANVLRQGFAWGVVGLGILLAAWNLFLLANSQIVSTFLSAMPVKHKLCLAF